MAGHVVPQVKDQTLAIIGCGNMGGSILTGVLRSYSKAIAEGQTPVISKFIATVSSEGSAKKLRTRFSDHEKHLEVTTAGNDAAMRKADIVLLGFKPYMVDSVLSKPGVQEALKGKLVISVLAGTPLPKIYRGITGVEDLNYMAQPHEQREYHISRVMPNMAAEFGEGMSVIESTSLAPEYESLVDWIFLQIGRIAKVAPELYDLGGVLAGTTTAFVSLAFDGMLDGAVSQGLKRAEAKNILSQTLRGLATMLDNDEHPALIREKTASPRGTTIAGLLSLEEDGVRSAYSKAIIKATERSLQIGK
ncbi:pyrroline-5-carboxylate reductase dimerization-domain-containing protein [Xylogone sp. PMI_703]|nr:pyrroline-5-carboxylate reductase dimerization-domain-containing protein [Xylogone sp. PMI_703]